MSIVALSYVLRYSEARLGARLTLITLAEFAHDDGSKAFPSIDTLMERTRLSKTGVKDALRKLREDGEIVPTGTTRSGTVIYRLTLGSKGSDSDRSDSDPGRIPTSGGPDSDPDPLVNRQPLRGEKERARPFRIGGQQVNATFWATTLGALGEFNSQTGRRLDATTGAGEPSEAAKRIYGRVRAFPSLSVAEHADIIRRTLASRWWGEGEATVGVVYGPKVFEENLTRSDTPAGAAQRRDASSASATMRGMAAELRNAGRS